MSGEQPTQANTKTNTGAGKSAFRYGWLPAVRRAWWLGWAVAAGGVAHADTGTLNFSGTIEAGTCNLSLDKPTIDFGNVDPTPIVTGGGWAAVKNTPFTITLSGCQGVGDASKTPGVQIVGPLNQDTAIQSAGGNKWLFKTGGTSQGFGVVVYNTTPASPGGNEAANNEYINVPTFGQGTTLPGAGATIPLSAAVSGGRPGWIGTKGANLKAGTLTAAVTFTFSYH